MSLIIFESRNVGPFNVLSNYSVVHRKEEFPEEKPARRTIELPFRKSLGKNVYTNIRRTAFLGKQSRLKPLRTIIELTFH